MNIFFVLLARGTVNFWRDWVSLGKWIALCESLPSKSISPAGETYSTGNSGLACPADKIGVARVESRRGENLPGDVFSGFCGHISETGLAGRGMPATAMSSNKLSWARVDFHPQQFPIVAFTGLLVHRLVAMGLIQPQQCHSMGQAFF